MIQKIRSLVLFSLLACGGVAAQTPPAAALRQPRPVAGIEDPVPWSAPASPAAMVSLRGGVVYAAGRDLWASDGTTAGTRLIATLCEPYCTEVVALGQGEDVAFFAERTRYFDFTTMRVVRTDGTAAGTFRVPTTFSAGYYHFPCTAATVVGERLYFAVLTGNYDCTLWSSDGTAAGTAPLDPDVVFEGDLVPLGGEVYFLGYGYGYSTRGLWRASAETGRVELVRAFHGLPNLSRLTAAGGRLFFFGPPASRGLWTSDGTASGTLPLARFAVSAGGKALLAGLGGRAWFVADGGRGEELWSSDGSVAGTRAVTDFPDPHPFRAAPLTADKLARLGRRLVFPALHRGRVRLWSVSGNSSGAQPLQGCPGGCPVVAPLPLAVLGSRAVLVGMRHGAPAELWVTDGTGPGTLRLRSAPGFSGLTAAGGGALFLERGEDGLFVGATDGTPAGTAGRLAAADPARENLAAAVAALNGRLLFPALDPGGGGALWAVRPGDAAAEKVFLPPLHAAQPGDDPSHTLLELVSRAGGRALAWAGCYGGLFATDSWQVEHLIEDDDIHACDYITAAVPAGDRALIKWTRESDALGDAHSLWGTDGTLAGTFSITGTFGSRWWLLQGPVALADRALFITNEGAGLRLWHSDGSAAGTGTEVEVPRGNLDGAAADSSAACFFADRPPQLWCSDGTAAGTRTVGPVLTDPRLQRTIESGIASLAGRFYFCSAGDSPSLFALDEQGLAEIRLGEAGIVGSCSGMNSMAGRIWFQERVVGIEEERRWLAVSDGTQAGTLRLAELPGPASNLTALGGAVLFVVDREADGGRELWRSDGTASGTRPFLEIAHPSYPTAPGPVVAGGRLWFAGFDPEHGVELWSTDGTAAGTRLETDLAPGPAWSRPYTLLPVGDKLYFTADDTERSGVWVLDLGGS